MEGTRSWDLILCHVCVSGVSQIHLRIRNKNIQLTLYFRFGGGIAADNSGNCCSALSCLLVRKNNEEGDTPQMEKILD